MRINYREIIGNKDIDYPFNLEKYKVSKDNDREIKKLLRKIKKEYKGKCEKENILHSLGRWVQYFKIEKDKPDFSNNVYKSMYEQGWRGSFKNSLMNTTERNKQDMGTKRLEGDSSLESGQTPEQKYKINNIEDETIIEIKYNTIKNIKNIIDIIKTDILFLR